MDKSPGIYLADTVLNLGQGKFFLVLKKCLKLKWVYLHNHQLKY